MPETLEDTINEAKRQKALANAAEAKEEIARELGYDSSEEMIAKTANETGGQLEDSAFAKSAVEISKSQHNATDENVQQTHSNVNENILAPVIELAIIQEATKKENAAFKQFQTVDNLTQRENDIIESEIDEMHKDILQLLVSLKARGRDDANKNLDSMVAGEQARLSAQVAGLNPASGTPGFWRKIGSFFKAKA